MGQDLRWPLQKLTVTLGVANAGINGNKLLTDSTCFGEEGLSRFQFDVLDQPRVRTVIVLLGVNDIGSGGAPDFGCAAPRLSPPRSSSRGHRALIRAAHERGVTIIGAMLTPFKGNEYGYDTEHNEAVRDALNHWIRNSGEYDAVVDLDRALSDPDDPDALLPAYDAGDHLHPNDAGMRAIAEAIDLDNL